MKTYMATAQTVEKEWFVVDAQGLALGRLASRIAMVLRGKHKASYTPHEDAGDFVIVVNADKVRLTGRKLDQKMYYWHSGYPGGIKSRTARQMLGSHKATEVLERAVKGMLPKNVLGRHMLKKLKIYAEGDHPHQAQQPRPLEL